MALIVYNYRNSTLLTSDNSMIALLEGWGHQVQLVSDSQVASHDYTGAKLLFIAGRGTDYVEFHTAHNFIQTLPINVLSTCRGTSRNTLGMSTATTTINNSSWSYQLPEHRFVAGTTDGSIGNWTTTQVIQIPTPDTQVIAITSTLAEPAIALAERVVAIGSENYSYVHFFYMYFNQLNATGQLRMQQIINELTKADYMLEGNRILGPFPGANLSKKMKINWVADTPEGTNIKIETMVTDFEELSGKWVQQTNGQLIAGILDNIVNKNLWIKQTLSTNNSEVTPVLTSLKLEVDGWQELELQGETLNVLPLAEIELLSIDVDAIPSNELFGAYQVNILNTNVEISLNPWLYTQDLEVGVFEGTAFTEGGIKLI